MTTGYPYNEEREYIKLMDSLLVSFARIVISELLPAFADARDEFDDATKSRGDAWPQTIQSAINRVRFKFNEKVKASDRPIRKVGAGVFEENKKFFYRSLTGLDALASERWLIPLVNSWSMENANLIKSIQEQYLGRVSQRAQDAVRAGTSVQDFAKELEKAYNLSKSRAELIARDQVGKLNGQLTRARSMRANLDEYEWQTSGDERVRDSHKVLNGKICKYSDPEVYREEGSTIWKRRASIGGYVGIPGEDFQCRCVALAQVEDYINSLLEDVA